MKKNIFKIIFAALFLTFIGGVFSVKNCYAASAEVDITSDSNAVTVGDEFFVYIKINSNTTFGDFEANLSYNDEVLAFLEGGSDINGNNGFLKISDIGVSDGDNSRKYTMKFKALKVGDSRVAFSGQAMVYDYETGDEMSISSNVLTVDVKSKKTASKNTNLKSLKISPSKLTPEFDKSVHKYSTTVSNQTEKLIVNAVQEDEKSTVSISGNDFLKEGENKVIVSVLAESGTVIEYTINVNREKAPQEQITPQVSVAPSDVNADTFEVVQTDGEFYAVYNGKYKLVEPDSEVTIPEGYEKTTITISEKEITAYAPISRKNSEIILIYAENMAGEKGFYYFDRVEKTMLRYTSNSSMNSTLDQSVDTTDMQPNQDRTKLKIAVVIMIILSGICTLLIAIIIRLYMKRKGYQDDDLE